ncbi:VOC family protein [Rhodopseudomonas sp. HC1]|uniref:VOC family protein n=1 Tax=Rhodopseudomonas infernalis TaxID=2897386 RepID=UPI001EE9567C|nr:VOC family protein [Rhodopseudomonas infernalis]MCG6203754.1 VOC family protein [Rhodopseudomonas infernalis]
MSDRTIATIDHLLTYVNDLDEAASLFRRMGFTLSPISRIEPMGISNYLVLMQPLVDGFANFLELMAAHDRSCLPPAMAGVLSGEQGTKSMVLGARDAAGAYALMRDRGFDASPPIHVRREWFIAPGESVFPEFDVILPIGAELTFNACQYHNVGLYLRPEWLTHANGARHLRRVLAVADDPSALASRFGKLFAPSSETVSPGGVQLDIITPEAAAGAYGAAASLSGKAAAYLGYVLEVESLPRLRACLEAGAVAYRCEGKTIIIDPNAGLGNLIVFTEDGT